MIGIELQTSNQHDRAVALVRVIDDSNMCYLDTDRIGTNYIIFYGSNMQCDWVSNGQGECPIILEHSDVLARFEELYKRFEEFRAKRSVRVVRTNILYASLFIWKLSDVKVSLEYVGKLLKGRSAKKTLLAYSTLLECEEVLDEFLRAEIRREQELERITHHTPDYDLKAYLANNTDCYTLDDIVNVHALVPGHNDESKWYWILELKPTFEKRFVLTEASCDYTGWDCSSSGSSQMAESAEKAALLAPLNDAGRAIRRNLLAQLRGKQAFGVEVIPAP